MVENRARESAKIIPETGHFLSEMISDLIDSPPTSPPHNMSNSKLRDCLKAAQSNNKGAKKFKQKDELICKTQDKPSKSHERDRTRKRDRRKPGREKLVRPSKDKINEVEAEDGSPIRKDKSKKKKNKEEETRRYEDTLIDDIVISAFKSWEDLQDEVNERISANQAQDNQCNQQTPISPSEIEQHGSTSQASPVLQSSQKEPQAALNVASKHKLEPKSSTTIEQNSLPNSLLPLQPNISSQTSHQSPKKKRHREREHDSISGPKPTFDRQPHEGQASSAEVPDSPKVTGWVPGRDLLSRSMPNERVPSDMTCNIGPPHLSQPFSGQSNQRLDPPFDAARREFEAQFNRAKQQHIFGPPPLTSYDHGHAVGNAFHQNHSGAAIGLQMSSTNQYLQDYFGPNSYNHQHMRASNPYGLPAANHTLFPPYPPFPGPNSLSTPYTSPYTITDTIISRQTIIPPPMGAGRFSHLPGPLGAMDHGPSSMMKYPSYVPSPTERSFMEFARSYANANNISGFMGQAMNSNATPPSNPFDPSFERFLAEQRAMDGASAQAGLHPSDPTSRFGVPNYHKEARSAIHPTASFYPHLFR